jgi:hypothetical protein
MASAGAFHAGATIRRLARNYAIGSPYAAERRRIEIVKPAELTQVRVILPMPRSLPLLCYSDLPTEDDNLIAPQMTKIPMARAINQTSRFIAP